MGDTCADADGSADAGYERERTGSVEGICLVLIGGVHRRG